jgi:aryl-alcohol dehydrogenase-like predicted oxidoreductase
MTIEQRMLGRSGLRVSALGLGAGRIGAPSSDDRDIARLLHGALDRGVTLIDTARSYGASEERIGRILEARREQYVLSTKVGYGVDGVEDWTGECVTRGIENALGRLRTDRIDVVFLHSCARPVLERGDCVSALVNARQAGKVRAIGYSGEDDALAWAVASGVFDVAQCSVNLVDQGSLEALLPEASTRGVGVLAKRPLANAAFSFVGRPDAPDVATYFDRWQTLALDPHGHAWPELAIRFSAFAEPVASAIVGTSRLEGLEACIDAVARGPLEAGHLSEMRERFRRHGTSWKGLV